MDSSPFTKKSGTHSRVHIYPEKVQKIYDLSYSSLRNPSYEKMNKEMQELLLMDEKEKKKGLMFVKSCVLTENPYPFLTVEMDCASCNLAEVIEIAKMPNKKEEKQLTAKSFALPVAKGIFQALFSLSEMNKIHGDLKPTNILLFGDPYEVITDVTITGWDPLSQWARKGVVEEKMHNLRPISLLSPEERNRGRFDLHPQSTEIDVYRAGRIIHECCSVCVIDELERKIWEIIKNCLEREPSKRPTVDQVQFNLNALTEK